MINIAQLLGYPSGSKLLIIHADDVGMCHSVNRATFIALEEGAISSASVMVPCPAFAEAAEIAAQHPQYDIGIHSTLISEHEDFKANVTFMFACQYKGAITILAMIPLPLHPY